MRPRRRANWWQLGWLLGALMVGAWVVSLAGVIVWERRDAAQPSSAIVVLGAAQYVGRPSPVLRARLDHAIDLWRRGLAPKIIFTGGFGDRDTTSEAAVGQRYAIEHGVPARAIMIENSGRTTSASLEHVASLMDAEPTRDVILVSDPFHMLRLSILARRLGLIPHTSPTRTSPISMNRREAWKYTLAESIKVPIAFLLQRREP
ncbi:MAG TPA: YdcF family protein [Gemmatimonadaceae bacterium]|nr:YdcF family protein [Gemmatimonadaceae bacterium]